MRNIILQISEQELSEVISAYKTLQAFLEKVISEDDLNRFINNGDHFPASVVRDKENGKFYYQFSLFSHKSLELIKKCVKEISGYPSKFDKKLYLLNDGTYLRASKRDTINVIYDANWFPDLESFEWFYILPRRISGSGKNLNSLKIFIRFKPQAFFVVCVKVHQFFTIYSDAAYGKRQTNYVIVI